MSDLLIVYPADASDPRLRKSPRAQRNSSPDEQPGARLDAPWEQYRPLARKEARMALEMDVIEAPARTKKQRYTSDDAAKALAAIKKLEPGTILGFDKPQPKPHNARTLARNMIAAIHATGDKTDFITSAVPIGTGDDMTYRAGLRIKE